MGIVEKLRVYQEAARKASEKAVEEGMRREKQEGQERIRAQNKFNALLNDQIRPLVQVVHESNLDSIFNDLITELKKDGCWIVKREVRIDIDFYKTKENVPTFSFFGVKPLSRQKDEDSRYSFYTIVKIDQSVGNLDQLPNFDWGRHPNLAFSSNAIEEERRKGKYQAIVDAVENNVVGKKYILESKLEYSLEWEQASGNQYIIDVVIQNQPNGQQIMWSQQASEFSLVGRQWTNQEKVENIVVEAYVHSYRGNKHDPGPFRQEESSGWS